MLKTGSRRTITRQALSNERMQRNAAVQVVRKQNRGLARPQGQRTLRPSK